MKNSVKLNLERTVIEREVEDEYNKALEYYFPTDRGIEHPFACDGLITTETREGKLLKLLIEYKFDEDFTTRAGISKVLCQALYYMKRFENSGAILPNVIMIADRNECFVLHSNCLVKYLDFEVDWDKAPSGSYVSSPELLLALSGDTDINPFVFKVDSSFNFEDVVSSIYNLASNVQRLVHITEHNIDRIFEYFCDRVVSDKTADTKIKVMSFIGTLIDHGNYYQHPNKKNILVTPLGNISIRGSEYLSFFSYFARDYSPRENAVFTSIADRLIEDTERRKTGDFWTPTIWVDYAHKRISDTLGEDWKEKYVVWDNCCGSLNLTRDYRFKELYCSTLFQEELELGKRYNPEATKFQFDFLNDDLNKIPPGLKQALTENKPIVFFLNPPYAQASNRNETSKKDVAKTKANEEMGKENLGQIRRNLYVQFLYNINCIKNKFNLTNCYICVFCPTTFLTLGSGSKFRELFQKSFVFNSGYTLKASEFANVSDSWSILFSIWNTGVSLTTDYCVDVCEKVDSEIITRESQKLYNTNNVVSGQDWVNTELVGLKRYDVPQLSSAINYRDSGTGSIVQDALGSFISYGNNVDQNTTNVSIMSSAFSNRGNVSIIPSNFIKCTSLFSSRKLIECTWKTYQKEYLAPNESHPKWSEFVSDSVVFSLFHSSSNQSSLRRVDYKGKKWDIRNEFFWMPLGEMKELADKNRYQEMWDSCIGERDRFVYSWLVNNCISKEGLDVLNKSRELIIKSLPYRKLFSESHPEYQIENWDCGWYQIKAVLKEYLPKDLEEFKAKYKILADKMRPMVYELGFLK